MPNDPEFVVNMVVPDDLSRELQRLTIDGFRVEAVSDLNEDASARFGLTEAVTVIAVVKGILDAVKLGLELLRLLKERAQKKGGGGSASLSTPDGQKVVIITVDMKSSEVEKEIRHAFTAAG